MHHSKRWATTLIVPVVLLAVIVPGLVADAATSANSTFNFGPSVILTTDVLPGLDHAILHGQAAPTTRLTVALGLSTPDAGNESTLLNALYDPSSSLYHQFLTPAQFDSQFHVSTATLAATKSWLESSGLTASYVSGSGDLVGVQGTVAQLGSLLHTTFGDYSVGTINFVANEIAPSVPASLRLTAVSGLDTLQRMWTESEVGNSPVAASPHATATAATGYVGTLVPQDLWGVYDAPASDEGQGETAGMFGYGYPGSLVPDLRVYEQRMGLPAVPTRLVTENQVTNPPIPPDNDVFGDGEWNNDVDDIAGMAPKLSQLDMYMASTGYDPDIAIMFSDWASDPQGPKQMNASFGECESDPTSRFNPPQTPLPFGVAYGNQGQLLDEHSLEQAVLEGRTLFSSAGDEGGSCPLVILPVIGAGQGILPSTAPNDQNYPCASAYAVCVGGTVVTTNGTTNPVAADAPTSDLTEHPSRVNEQSWLYTGGGPAANVPRPPYQDGVKAIDLPCTEPVEPDGTPIPLGTTCRGAPDVAALSGSGTVDGELVGNNALLTNVDMLPYPAAGTSVSSPLVVGMWARIQAASPSTAKGVYGGLGFANETFYAVGKGEIGDPSRDYFDVTSSDTPLGNFYEQAGKGWDYTSGWGAIDVANFIRDVDHNSNLNPTHPTADADYASFFPQVVCSATMTSPLGNAYDGLLSLTSNVNDTELDMTSASLAPSANGKDLVATIYGPGLSTTGPPDAIGGYNFYVDWTYNGTTYFAAAEVDPPQQLPKTPATNSIPAPVSVPSGTVVFGDGTSSSPTPTITHTDVGSFSNHTITIVVPLANVGSPTAGSLLLFPFAFDTLPFGIFVATAEDEATTAGPGQAVELGSHC
jgi:pseudomonalisin